MVASELQSISTVHSPPRRIKNAMARADELRITESLTLNYSDAITEALDDLPYNFLLTDPSISGHPVVFASRGFLSMSGYADHDVIGRNPRFLQGPATDRQSVMEIREAIRTERTVQIPLLNYRSDGMPHRVLFHLCPVVDEGGGCVVHFLAVQVPIQKKFASRTGAVVVGSCREELMRCGSTFDDTSCRGLIRTYPTCQLFMQVMHS